MLITQCVISSGVLTQLAIVIGIMITQSMGLRLATPHTWRLVLLFSSALGAFQLVSSLFAVESPAWGADKQTRARIERRLWGAEALPSRMCEFNTFQGLSFSLVLTMMQSRRTMKTPC
jgi:hypothetical protein